MLLNGRALPVQQTAHGLTGTISAIGALRRIKRRAFAAVFVTN